MPPFPEFSRVLNVKFVRVLNMNHDFPRKFHQVYGKFPVPLWKAAGGGHVVGVKG